MRLAKARSHSFGWRACASVALIAALAIPRVAHADPAEDLVAKGIELREQGKDDEALALFRQADAMTPAPRTHAQVALAEQALGMWLVAEKHLRQSLVSHDPWIDKNRAALDGALEIVRKHIGDLEVRSSAPVAEVFVDGEKVGTLPATEPFRVVAGPRSVEVRAKGFHSSARTTDVQPGGVARESFDLVPEPTSSGAVGSDGSPGNSGERPPPSETRSPGATQRTMGWVLIGTGGAAAAFGLVGLILRDNLVASYNAECPGTGVVAQPDSCSDKLRGGNNWQTVYIVSFVSAGVLAAGGATLLLTAPSGSAGGRAKNESGPRIACSVAGFGFGVACAGTF